MIEHPVDVAPATPMDAGHPHGRQCAATSRRSGERCGRAATVGRSVCYYHGSATPVGALSPNFTSGRYSRHLPLHLAERFEEAQNDPDRLSFGDEIALLDTRIGELLGRCQSHESGSAWRLAEKLWKDFQRFRAAGNDGKVQETLTALAEPLETGLRDHHGWAEIGEAIDRRARLVVLEQQRVKELQATLTVSEAMSLIAVILETLKRHVTDEAILQAIGDDLAQLIALDATPIGARSRRQRR